MYNIERKDTIFLYNKSRGMAIRRFDSLYELRNFIESKLLEAKRWDNPYPTRPHGLSMSFEQTFMDAYEYNWRLGEYVYRTYAVNDDVLLYPDWRIFNYTEMVNEIESHRVGCKITYGIGHTYKGNPCDPSPKYRCRYTDNGHKRAYRTHDCHVVFPLDEREDLSKIEKDDLVEEIGEMGVDVSPNIIKNINKKIRPHRVSVAGSIHAAHYEKSHCLTPHSWKEKKRQRQWMRSECKQHLRHPEYHSLDTPFPESLHEVFSENSI